MSEVTISILKSFDELRKSITSVPNLTPAWNMWLLFLLCTLVSKFTLQCEVPPVKILHLDFSGKMVWYLRVIGCRMCFLSRRKLLLLLLFYYRYFSIPDVKFILFSVVCNPVFWTVYSCTTYWVNYWSLESELSLKKLCRNGIVYMFTCQAQTILSHMF
jgi:hypothetical protein